MTDHAGAPATRGGRVRDLARLNIQVAASSLMVLASPSPDAYAWHRVWETAAGAAVTILLAPLLWPPDPHRVLAGIADDCRARLPAPSPAPRRPWSPARPSPATTSPW
ncbi:hypothetical protein [Streptomyces sp. NPDC088762]|uniref:hypothetical protein n=1 Tax=Streptomyces sp. NPDC088762 TaxID=3365891 RepID=UPI0038008BEC